MGRHGPATSKAQGSCQDGVKDCIFWIRHHSLSIDYELLDNWSQWNMHITSMAVIKMGLIQSILSPSRMIQTVSYLLSSVESVKPSLQNPKTDCAGRWRMESRRASLWNQTKIGLKAMFSGIRVNRKTTRRAMEIYLETAKGGRHCGYFIFESWKATRVSGIDLNSLNYFNDQLF